jgi:hypothetical protein
MLEKAIETVQRSLREFISFDKREETLIYTKIFSHLVNSWVEVRFMKLIYEYGAFSDQHKTKIISCKQLERKWRTALNIAFCKAFAVSNPRKINIPTVPFTAQSQYAALSSIITSDLLDSSSIRNRIAHGQWKYAFSENMTKINGKLTSKLGQENILMIQFRLAMFRSLSQIIHDLAVSKPTFQRDFDANYKKIEEQRRNAQNTDYNKYIERMVQKKRKGILRKKRHFSRLKSLASKA